MSKHDYHTRTVDGARAWAERHAEYEPDDRDGDDDWEPGRGPSCPRREANCGLDEYDEGWGCSRCGHSVAK